MIDLQVSPDGSILAAMGAEGDVTLFDPTTWRPFGKPVVDGLGKGFLSFTDDSLRMYGETGPDYELSTDPADWVAAGCRTANTELTPEESARHPARRTGRADLRLTADARTARPDRDAATRAEPDVTQGGARRPRIGKVRPLTAHTTHRARTVAAVTAVARPDGVGHRRRHERSGQRRTGRTAACTSTRVSTRPASTFPARSWTSPDGIYVGSSSDASGIERATYWIGGVAHQVPVDLEDGDLLDVTENHLAVGDGYDAERDLWRGYVFDIDTGDVAWLPGIGGD